MILKVINHDFIYDMKNLCTVFFPWEKINDDGKDNIEVETKAQGNEFFVCARLFDKSISKTHILKEKRLLFLITLEEQWAQAGQNKNGDI